MRSLLAATLGAVAVIAGCSLLHTRPVQTMSDTHAAIRAAREVQSDTLAPELYRQANEWFFRAKKEYKFKNFSLASEYADKARIFAEQAEFESIRNGGTRSESAPDPLSNSAAPAPAPYAYPTPTGTPADQTLGKPQGAPQAPAPGPSP